MKQLMLVFAARKYPAGHTVQLNVVMSIARPAAHIVQVVEFHDGAALPAGHVIQAELPAVSEYVPGAQPLHEVQTPSLD